MESSPKYPSTVNFVVVGLDGVLDPPLNSLFTSWAIYGNFEYKYGPGHAVAINILWAVKLPLVVPVKFNFVMPFLLHMSATSLMQEAIARSLTCQFPPIWSLANSIVTERWLLAKLPLAHAAYFSSTYWPILPSVPMP